MKAKLIENNAPSNPAEEGVYAYAEFQPSMVMPFFILYEDKIFEYEETPYFGREDLGFSVYRDVTCMCHRLHYNEIVKGNDNDND